MTLYTRFGGNQPACACLVSRSRRNTLTDDGELPETLHQGSPWISLPGPQRELCLVGADHLCLCANHGRVSSISTAHTNTPDLI
ncbi:unnamed protein product [Urochloa humidicola]